ncbi:hypothetical protein BJ508DRAFT_315472 [Ascobolus immersus RN42]|uniref:F-box domain-containing protein n=1 Tax=Ascobolus immersus RN42 TaxID=1160509 RepID=A0A3N4HGW0_ASCIM|nr:hypothetical protein BJ508DRAFT_315472 [Ascobolus immersus RN42]
MQPKDSRFDRMELERVGTFLDADRSRQGEKRKQEFQISRDELKRQCLTTGVLPSLVVSIAAVPNVQINNWSNWKATVYPPSPFVPTKTLAAPWSSQPLPILRLPSELIIQIFSRISTPQTYLTLIKVCRQLYTIGSRSFTRRLFAVAWFNTYCNDAQDQAPRVIEYLARYIRLHCIQGNGDAPCSTVNQLNNLHTGVPVHLMPLYHGNTRHVSEGCSWRAHAFAEFTIPCFRVQQSELYARAIEQVELTMEHVAAPQEGWTMENISRLLEVPDVVFADSLVRLFHELEEEQTVKSRRCDILANDCNDHRYLAGMQLMRDQYICCCTVLNPTSIMERQKMVAEQEASDAQPRRLCSITAPLKFY